MLAYRRSIDKVHVGQVQSSLAKIKYYVVLFFLVFEVAGCLAQYISTSVFKTRSFA